MRIKLNVAIVIMMVLSCLILGCSEADKVNANISKQADYFECEIMPELP